MNLIPHSACHGLYMCVLQALFYFCSSAILQPACRCSWTRALLRCALVVAASL